MSNSFKSVFLAYLLALVGSAASAQNALVIRDARIVTGSGPAIERGTVVMQGDKIVAVGVDVAIPAGAQVLDGKGLTVYPGLVDAYCLAGVAAPPTAPANAPSNQDRPRRQGRGGNFTPPPPTPLVWRKATEGFNAKLDAITAMRNLGYTAALFGTRGVLTPGEDVLMALTPGEPSAMLIQDRAAINVNTMSRGFSTYPSTLMGAFAFLRQAFYDGLDYRSHPPAKPETRLDGLASAAEGRIPVFYAAGAENDIQRALRIADEFHLNLIVLGGREAEKAAPHLAAHKAAVALTDDWTPAIALAKAGVPFALASGKLEMSVSDANEQRDKALALLEKGLPAEALLAALTRVPAELLGVGDRLGSIAPGKLANLVVTDGDLWSKTGKVKFVVVKGQKIEPVTVKAESSPPRTRIASDGVPFTSSNEDEADDEGGER